MMNARLFLFFGILHYVHCMASLKGDTPPECIKGNYHNLIGQEQEHRHLEFTSDSTTFSRFNKTINDRSLAFNERWFRFNVIEANRMLEKKDLPMNVRGDMTTFRPCGTTLSGRFFSLKKNFMNSVVTSFFYVVNNDIGHPRTKYERVVTTSVPCFYRAFQTGPLFSCHHRVGTNCSWSLDCDHTVSTMLEIRNCGDFFVYKAKQLPLKTNPDLYLGGILLRGFPLTDSKQGSFCGTNQPLPQKIHSQCSSKTNQYISEQQEDNPDCVLTQNKWVGFTSLPSNRTKPLPLGCTSSTTDSQQASLKTVFCGEEYHGWIEDGHPTIDEGIVTRGLCFSRPGSCKCELTTSIEMVKCGGGSYLYRKPFVFPHCLKWQ